MTTNEVRYLRTEQAEWSVGADGLFTVKDSSSGWFFPLNSVASTIWDRLDGTSTRGDIVYAICEEFEIDENTARTDLGEFIEQAVDLNLVTIITSPDQKGGKNEKEI
jgi:hypothetical protein